MKTAPLLLLCALIGIGSALVTNLTFHRAPIARTNFEYRIESLPDETILTKINDLGKDGWDIVSTRRAVTETREDLLANTLTIERLFSDDDHGYRVLAFRSAMADIARLWEADKLNIDNNTRLLNSVPNLRAVVKTSQSSLITTVAMGNDCTELEDSFKKQVQLLSNPLAVTEVILKRSK